MRGAEVSIKFGRWLARLHLVWQAQVARCCWVGTGPTARHCARSPAPCCSEVRTVRCALRHTWSPASCPVRQRPWGEEGAQVFKKKNHQFLREKKNVWGGVFGFIIISDTVANSDKLVWNCTYGVLPVTVSWATVKSPSEVVCRAETWAAECLDKLCPAANCETKWWNSLRACRPTVQVQLCRAYKLKQTARPGLGTWQSLLISSWANNQNTYCGS